MHMRGEPGDMQDDPRYDDVTAEVIAFLRERVEACVAAGIPRHQLLVDPGFGFAKTLEHNLRLLAELEALRVLELPMLVGLSRKGMIGKVLDRPVDERMPGSVAAAVLCVDRGASIVRAHDVKATLDGVRFAHAVNHYKNADRAPDGAGARRGRLPA